MSVLGQILQDRREEKRNAAVGAQIQSLLGSHADPGQQVQIGGPDQLVSQVGGREATGILRLPVDDRAEALAIVAAVIPGMQKESLSMMQTAIRNRQQDAMRSQEFNQSLLQNQGQFNQREEQDRKEWLHRRTIMDAQHKSGQELTALKIAAEMRGVSLDGLNREKTLLAIDKAKQDLIGLPAPAEKILGQMSLDFAHINQQLTEFDPRYAIDSVTLVGGYFEIDQNQKFAKSEAELNKMAFWARELEWQNEVTSRLSGANVSEKEESRLLRTFLTPTMNAKGMQKAYETRLEMLNRNKKLFLNQWRDQAVGVGARLPSVSLENIKNEKIRRVQSGEKVLNIGDAAPEGLQLTPVPGS